MFTFFLSAHYSFLPYKVLSRKLLLVFFQHCLLRLMLGLLFLLTEMLEFCADLLHCAFKLDLV